MDTHEHLIEESQRLSGAIHLRTLPRDDWAISQVLWEDLEVAGLPPTDLRKFLGPDLTSQDKYRLIAPYWERIRHTGYAQALRSTFRGVYGEEDLTAESLPRIAEKYCETAHPSFYARILDLANIKGCHDRSLQRFSMET